MGVHRSGLPAPGGARRPASCAACTRPTSCCDAAQALAAEIADNTAPVSVALSRQMLWRMLGADHPMEAHQIDSRAILARGRSDDAREGVTSFLEKRPAVFPVKVSDGLPDLFPGWKTGTRTSSA